MAKLKAKEEAKRAATTQPSDPSDVNVVRSVNADLRKENASLKAEIEKLKTELAALKKELEEASARPGRNSPDAATQPAAPTIFDMDARPKRK